MIDAAGKGTVVDQAADGLQKTLAMVHMTGAVHDQAQGLSALRRIQGNRTKVIGGRGIVMMIGIGIGIGVVAIAV